MKSLIKLFLFVFLLIWGLGAAVHFVQKAQSRAFSVSPDYGDFSPSKIEAERKEMMDNYKRQAQEYRNKQASSASSSQDAQRRFMEDQKRKMEDMKRQNQIGR